LYYLCVVLIKQNKTKQNKTKQNKTKQNMIRLFCTISLLILGVAAKAQEKLTPQQKLTPQSGLTAGEAAGEAAMLHRISGEVRDSLTQKGLAFATVGLLDSAKKVVQAVIADYEGVYRFENVKTGSYSVEASSINYRNGSLKSFDTDKKELAMPVILLRQATEDLKGVTVTALRPMLVMSGEKIVYNAENDPNVTGATTPELLRRLPYLSVDNDDNLLVKGSSRFKVKVNGRSSGMMARNPKEALQAFPASSILKVEIITTPSAKDDAEGAQAVINIITKKKMTGYNATVSTSASTIKQVSASGSVDAKFDKWGVSGYYGGAKNVAQPTGGNGISINNLNTSNPLTQTTSRTGENGSQWQWGNLEIAYDIDSMQTLSVYGNLNAGENTSSANHTRIFADKAGTITATNLLVSTNVSSQPNKEVGADFVRKWKGDHHEWTVSALYETGQSLSFSDNVYTNQYPFSDNLTLKNHSNSTTTETTISTNYSVPLGKEQVFTAGAKAILRNILSDYGQDKYVAASDSYTPLPDQSNVFRYDQDVFSAYLDYSWQFRKLTLHPGLRAEQTLVMANFQSSQTVAEQSYLTLIPTVSLSYKATEKTNWRLSFNRQISRPQVWYLNPYIDNQNPNSVSTGNPDLKPEMINSLELQYSYFKNGLNISVTAFNRYTTDVISAYSVLLDSTHSFTKKYNLGTANDVGIAFNLSGTLFKKLSYNTNINVGQKQIMTSLNGETRRATGFSGWSWGSLTYAIGDGWRTGVSGSYSLGSVMAQGTSSGWWNYNISVSKGFKKDAVRVRLYADNVFHDTFTMQTTLKSDTFSSFSTSYRPARAVGLGLLVKFGGLKESVSRKRGIENGDKKSGEK
jgi:outer membrane receptor protein involved in Fe transport